MANANYATTEDARFDDGSLMPLYLSCIAGASTCIGAAVVFLYPKGKKIGPETMSFSLALAGSVMLTVSALSIGPESMRDPLTGEWIPIFSRLFLCRLVSFAIGSMVYFLISWCAFPEPDELINASLTDEKPTVEEKKNLITQANGGAELCSSDLVRNISSESLESTESGQVNMGASGVRSRKTEKASRVKVPQANETYDFKWTSGSDLKTNDQRKAWRISVILFISLLIHNFPEGLAVAASAVRSEKLGFTVTIGIMIHNIPEGIAIAVPCLAARPNQPWLAFVMASVSGLAEPLGAAVALMFLKKFVQPLENGSVLCLENILAFVVGVMVTVALNELYPEARRHKRGGDCGHLYLYLGTVIGFIIMVLTEFFMDQ